MTNADIARAVVERFAEHGERHIWGCDHIRYKGADADLAAMIAEALDAAEKRGAEKAGAPITRPEFVRVLDDIEALRERMHILEVLTGNDE